MDCTMIRTGLNSVEFKTAKGVNVKINFSAKDNHDVEDTVTNNLLMSYEERIKKNVEDFIYEGIS